MPCQFDSTIDYTPPAGKITLIIEMQQASSLVIRYFILCVP